MTRSALLFVLSVGAIGLTATAAAADCESDMIQLETAMKKSNLSADAKAAFDDARVKSVTAMKKDDDTACHKAIGDAMTKAGITLN